MNSAEKYIIYGPVDTLKRLGSALIVETKPKHVYEYNSDEIGVQIHVSVYEETQKLMNISTSLTCILELSGKSLKVELASTGGRTGFRGSSSDSEIPVNEAVKDFILDFTKRFGLTIQENRPQENDTEEE